MRGADYLLKRTGFAVITVFVAVTLNFVLFRAVPGSAISAARCLHCTKQYKKALEQDLGLNQPKWKQYVYYIDDLAHANLGRSYADHNPVWQDLRAPIVNTLPMLLVGTAVSILLGIVTGVV